MFWRLVAGFLQPWTYLLAYSSCLCVLRVTWLCFKDQCRISGTLGRTFRVIVNSFRCVLRARERFLLPPLSLTNPSIHASCHTILGMPGFLLPFTYLYLPAPLLTCTFTCTYLSTHGSCLDVRAGRCVVVRPRRGRGAICRWEWGATDGTQRVSDGRGDGDH